MVTTTTLPSNMVDFPLLSSSGKLSRKFIQGQFCPKRMINGFGHCLATFLSEEKEIKHPSIIGIEKNLVNFI